MDKNAFKEAKGLEKGTNAAATTHLSYVINWKTLQHKTETLPFNNNNYNTWRAHVWKNAVHIMGLICMTLHALDKITFINSKIADIL